MGLETGSFIPELVDSNPDGVDPKSEGDNHLRLIKTCVQGSFPAFVGTTAVPKFVGLTEDQLTDAALKSADNVFGGLATFSNGITSSIDGSILLSTGIPILGMRDTGQGVDEKVFDIAAFNSELLIRTADDLGAGNVVALSIQRTGTTVDSVTLHQSAAGLKRWQAGSNGSVFLYADGDTDTETHKIDFVNQTGAGKASLGYTASSILTLNNGINGAGVDITANNAGGSPTTLFSSDPDSVGELYAGGVLRFRVEGAGVIAVRGDDNTDTSSKLLTFNHADGVLRARIGISSGDPLNFQMRNSINGGNLSLQTTNAAAALRNILIGDPDGLTTLGSTTDLRLNVNVGVRAINCAAASSVELYFNAIRRFSTRSDGHVRIFSDDSTDTSSKVLEFVHQDGTSRGNVGYTGAADLQLLNEVNGGRVLITARTAGGVATSQINCDPDVGVILPVDATAQLGFYGSAGAVKQTITGAKGANEALTSLMPALAALGLVIDNTTF